MLQLIIEGPVGSEKGILMKKFKELLEKESYKCYDTFEDIRKLPNVSMRFEKKSNLKRRKSNGNGTNVNR